jgi:hypothetical protein
VRVVRDGGGPSGSAAATSQLLMVDATIAPNAESGRVDAFHVQRERRGRTRATFLTLKLER